MKNKELQQAVESYLESSDEQAFQIDGLWGTGKTYFVQNKLENVFKHTKYIPLYVSLNGISNFDEINKILSRLAILSTNDAKNKYKTFSKIESTLEMIDTSGLAGTQAHGVIYLTQGFLKFREKNLQKKIKFEKFVLIFDELERVPNFKLLLNFLGHMSNLQNQWRCKSIVVSNEEKFCQLNDYIAGKYMIVKEKFISRTWKFGNDSIEVAKTLIMESIQQEKNSIISNWVNKLIDSLLKIISPINIRIIKSILTTYNQFYKEIISMKIDDKVREQSLKTGFLAIFSLTYMVKMGKLVSESSLNSIFNRSSQEITFINSKTNETKSSKPEKGQKKNESLSFLNETFLNKFIEFDHNIIYSRQITNLVMHGYMNYDQFIQEIRDSFLPQISRYQYLLTSLQNFRTLRERDLITVERETKDMLENGSFNYNQLTQFYILIQRLNKKNLWFGEPPLNNLAQKIANEIKLSDITGAGIEIYLDMYLSNIQGVDLNVIKSAISSRRKTLLEDHNNKTIDYILKNDIYRAINNNNNNDDEFAEASLFNQLVNKKSEFLNRNTSLIGINRFITNEILNLKNSYDFYSKEVPYLEKLQRVLRDNMVKTTDKVVKFNQETLLETLDEAEKKLNKTSNN